MVVMLCYLHMVVISHPRRLLFKYILTTVCGLTLAEMSTNHKQD
jgi:hypothetical protein